MVTLLRSAFFRRFAGGFTLGVAALVALQPATVKANLGIGTPVSQQVG